MVASNSSDIDQTRSQVVPLLLHHRITFIGVLLFTLFVFFRPYETIPGAEFLSGGAFFIATATLLVFLPFQFAATGTVTLLPREVKCVLVLVFLALLTVPIAKDPSLALERFSEQFIKAALMFIVMVNVLVNWQRVRAIIYVSLAVSVYLSLLAVKYYVSGEAVVEGYRVGIDEIGGLFGNPNEVALHLVTMCPIAFAFGLGSRRIIVQIFYYSLTVLFAVASAVTYSRGAFLGLLAGVAVMSWKLGRKSRAKVFLVLVLLGGSFLFLAPTGYGVRVLSIFTPALDPTGSSLARSESLKRSILVTLRNPWGIGMGNFSIVGIRNHETHNSYTQVSTELGVLGLAAYLVFVISPLRKLGQLEREMFSEERFDWRYYLSIGLQCCIASFLVSSFFGSVAYGWYAYYLIAYAVCFRMIYCKEREFTKETEQSQQID
jgi:putative inorganic carbon (hco3(-)) transporter